MKPDRRERWLLLFSSAALLLVSAACGGHEPAEARVEPPTFGTIEPEPFVRLPAVNQEDRQFTGIVGAYRLPDGCIVVADASQKLRWFDAAGRPGRAVGVGAQEAHADRALMWMRGYRGDSLIAYDAASGQLSVFDAEGLLARRFRFATDALPGLTLPDSPFPDGSILAMAGPSHVQQRRDGWWAVLQLLTFTPEGYPLERLGTALRHPCERNAVEHCAAEVSLYSGTWTAGLTGAYTARPDLTELRLVTGDSALVLKGPAGWERPEEELPTYSRLLLDSEGDLWAQSGDLSRAVVFDRHGHFAGTIRVPAELQIYQVGPDFVLGVIEDADGEGVQVHRLYRARSAPSS